MGFDLSGLNPHNNHGVYFHSSIWRWPAICGLIEDTGVLDDEAIISIQYNDGYVVEPQQAYDIGIKIRNVIKLHPRNMKYASIEKSVSSDTMKALNTALKKAGIDLPGGIVEASENVFVEQDYIKMFVKFAINSGGFKVD
jgi:hypothetical protein